MGERSLKKFRQSLFYNYLISPPVYLGWFYLYSLSMKLSGEQIANQRIAEYVIKHIDELGEQKRGKVASQKPLSPTLLPGIAQLVASIYLIDFGVILLDANLKVNHMNRAAVRIFQDASLFFSQKVRDIPQTRPDECFLALLKEQPELVKAIQGAIKERVEVKLDKVAYKEQVLRIFFTPIIWEGATHGCCVIVEDVTEQHRCDQAREEFFCFSTHELRTPLIAMAGCAKLISEDLAGKINPDTQALLDELKTSSERMVKMVGDYLNMMKLEHHQFSYDVTTFDLGEICQSVVKELSPIAKARHLFLEFDTPLMPLVAYADDARVREIITNLIGNALKYTDKGGITISCLEGDRTALIKVKDSGRGIPPELQDQLFKRFHQINSKTASLEPNQSSGLGLYISRMMAEGMGGSLYLEESAEKAGSTFTLKLPRS